MKRITPGRLSVLALLTLLVMVGGVLADSSSVSQSLLAPVVSNASCTTVVSPGQSIQAAITNAQSGHVICVRAGTYHEQLMFKINKAGITVQAYPGERPILDGRNIIPTGQNQGLVQINASDVTVDGFEVRNSAARGVIIGHPTNGTQSLRNAVVRNLTVRGSHDSGINVNGTDQYHLINILIENNVVFDNLRKNAGGTVGGSALTFIDVDNSIARGNTIYNNLGEGLVADRWTNNLTFEDNISFDNKNSNIYLSTTKNPLVQRNLVFCTDDRNYWRDVKGKPPPGIMMRDEDYEGQSVKPPASSGQVIINNIVVGCGINFGVSTQFPGGGLNGALIANNTFVNARGDDGSVNNVLFEGDANYKNSSFVNNLILQAVITSVPSAHVLSSLGTPDLSSFTLANNLYSNAPSKSWPTNEAGRVLADPRLVNPVLPVKGSIPAASGYALQSNSPAINAGRAVAQVTVDFFSQGRGGVLDIGADEVGGGTAPTTGQIIVAKSTSPERSAQVFTFTASYAAGGFQLTDGGTHASGELPAGTYSVSMAAVDGWATTASCSDGSAPGSIALAAGETVTCTFQSEQQSEPVTRIIVRKETIPAGDSQTFQFTSDFAGTFSLGHGQRETADVAAGVYSVAETVPTGWTQASATCSDGSPPNAINLSSGETVTCTFVNQKQGGGGGDLEATVYVTTTLDGVVGGVTYSKGDILAFNGRTGQWSIYFDASDVGINNALNDFTLAPDGSLLIAISGRTTLKTAGGSFKLQLWDIARFVPTRLGDDTAGVFELYFDGSDVGLSQSAEKIDALALKQDGTLLISTYGTAAVPSGATSLRAQDEDLLAFKPTTVGGNTQGAWSLAFDGSAVPGLGVEDVTSAWHHPATGDLYLTFINNFSVNGASGAALSVLAVKSNGGASIFWNAADEGFTGPITGLHVTP